MREVQKQALPQQGMRIGVTPRKAIPRGFPYSGIPKTAGLGHSLPIAPARNPLSSNDSCAGRFESYLAHMARDGAWGDHVTLQARVCAVATSNAPAASDEPPFFFGISLSRGMPLFRYQHPHFLRGNFIISRKILSTKPPETQGKQLKGTPLAGHAAKCETIRGQPLALLPQTVDGCRNAQSFLSNSAGRFFAKWVNIFFLWSAMALRNSTSRPILRPPVKPMDVRVSEA